MNDLIYMSIALAEAKEFEGATAPNPPVGACLVKEGRVLATGAHERAGSAHAEIVALNRALEKYGEQNVQGSVLYVTLEPCNHHGKTPPCTQAILKAGVSKVVIGAIDPNPLVQGNGIRVLRDAGIEVIELNSDVCRELIAPFQKFIITKTPWVTHKLAFRLDGEGRLTMLPEDGQKTFTSSESLKMAHLERKKSDAILTSVETILADSPLFNVRNVRDHTNKIRLIAVITRSGKSIPEDWLRRQKDLGFEVLCFTDIDDALRRLGERGVIKVLVEAGPTLSQFIIESRLWNEQLLFVSKSAGTDREPKDFMVRSYACSQE